MGEQGDNATTSAAAAPRRGPRASASPSVKLSKKLSFALRHGAPKLGLTLRSDGYVRLDDLLRCNGYRGFSVEAVKEVVHSNDKQRFSLLEEDGGVLWIRANQGHSVTGLNEEELLTPIKDPSEAGSCAHGTYLKCWPSIAREGLKKMGRTHIHCAQGLVGEGVISGMRASSEVIIYVNVAAAMADGIRFFLSDNGVVLTSGMDGVLPPCYFARVINMKAASPGGSEPEILWPMLSPPPAR
jgi:2'-phosphotransferase